MLVPNVPTLGLSARENVLFVFFVVFFSKNVLANKKVTFLREIQTTYKTSSRLKLLIVDCRYTSPFDYPS